MDVLCTFNGISSYSFKHFVCHAQHRKPFLFLWWMLQTLVRPCGRVSLEEDWRGQHFGLQDICGWLSYQDFPFQICCCGIPDVSLIRHTCRHWYSPRVNGPKGRKRGKATLKPVAPLFPIQWAVNNQDLVHVSHPTGWLGCCWRGRAVGAFLAFAWGRFWPVTHPFLPFLPFLEATFMT